jgi:Xaa-Pro dipeptidase
MDHIAQNMDMLRPGVTIRELTFGGHQLDALLAAEVFLQDARCGAVRRMAFVPYPDGWVDGAFEAALEPGMVLCVEAWSRPRAAISRSSSRSRC